MQSILDVASCDSQVCQKNGMICNQRYPGFIGRNYKEGGLVIIGGKPASTDSAKFKRKNKEMQNLLDVFSKEKNEESFKEYMTELSSYMEEWSDINLVSKKMRQTLRYDIEDVAFINLVKCFSSKEAPDGNEMNVIGACGREIVEKCFVSHAKKQIEILKPKYVVLLGRSIRDTIAKLGLIDCEVWPAQNGTRGISEEEKLKEIRPTFEAFAKERTTGTIIIRKRNVYHD